MPEWTSHWLRDSRLLLLSEFFIVVMSTVVAIVLARGLGPSDWGIFSGLLGLSQALAIFVDLGLTTWLLRELSRLNKDEALVEQRRRTSSPLIVGGMIAVTALGLSVTTVAAIAMLARNVELERAFTLLGLLLYVTTIAIASCMGSFLRAERLLGRLVAGVVLERTLLLGLVAIALAGQRGLPAIALAYIVAGFSRILYMGVVVFVQGHVPLVIPDLHHIREFVFKGVPFAFNTMALVAIPKLDTLLVAAFSATAAGYFALGDRFLGPAVFIPVVASTALYPYLAREGRNSRAGWKISGGMMVLGALIGTAGVVLAPVVVPVVFGGEYDDAVPIVQIMLLALPFTYASNSLLVNAYSLGREKQLLFLTIVAATLGTAALITGLLVFGTEGAAVAYVFRQVLFTTVLSGIVARRPA